MAKRAKKHVATESEKLVIADFSKVYKAGLQTLIAGKTDPGRIKYIRPSQLPFCPAGFFVRLATNGPYRFLDFEGDFYTSIGTAVHTTAQKYLGRSGKYLADWHCKVCSASYKMSVKNSCCDTPMEYHEIEIDYKGVKGHIDAVFIDRKGRYWIKDFKTTSLKASLTKLSKPGLSYIEQIEAYAYLIWKQYGIRIHGVMLAFILRDNPKEPVVYARELKDSDYTRIGKRIIRDKKRHKKVLEISERGDALELLEYGKCGDPWCDVCGKAKDKRKEIIKQAFVRGTRLGYLPISNLVNKLEKDSAKAKAKLNDVLVAKAQKLLAAQDNPIKKSKNFRSL